VVHALQGVINPEYVDESFTIEKWLREPDSWLYYSPDLLDFAMFERHSNDWYEGHQWLGSRKGRAGIDWCEAVLEDFFKESNCPGVIGLTPIGNKPAAWMARKLGFQVGDAFAAPGGWVRLFFLTNPLRPDIIVK